MLKVRLMGTQEDIEWYRSILTNCQEIAVLEFSPMFSIKGSKRYYRSYVELVNKMEEQRYGRVPNGDV